MLARSVQPYWQTQPTKINTQTDKQSIYIYIDFINQYGTVHQIIHPLHSKINAVWYNTTILEFFYSDNQKTMEDDMSVFDGVTKQIFYQTLIKLLFCEMGLFTLLAVFYRVRTSICGLF